MKARILGTGSFVPEHRLTNDDLSRMVETSDSWIQERTGIRERRISDEGTTAMAVKASLKALENAAVNVDELDLILAATATSDYLFPGTACQVQAALGAGQAACFDISAACAGFVFALNTAQAYIAAGFAKKVLIIGAETLSKIIDWNDRSTCILFGDGAGAAVIGADETGILSIDMGSNGVKGMVLPCEGRPLINPLVNKPVNIQHVQMDGQEVFKFAIRTVPESILKALQKANVAKEDVKHYVLHQANQRILHSVAKSLTIPLDKITININQYGNTSAASVPILLDEKNQKGDFKKGDLVVISAFGAGLNWGSVVLNW